MKPGDRVRVCRGEHQGRLGTIEDADRKVSALKSVLLRSPVRDLIEKRFRPPDGYRLVMLDAESGRVGRSVTLPQGDLILVEAWTLGASL